VRISPASRASWPISARPSCAWEEELDGERGLVRAESGDGVIVTEDGFRAGRLTQDGFNGLCSAVGRKGTITEVDGSSVFCTLVK
jgi:hypothetical protein